MMQILKCASGRHELIMHVDDCAYCTIETVRTILVVKLKASEDARDWRAVEWIAATLKVLDRMTKP